MEDGKLVLFGTGKMLPEFEKLLKDSGTEFYCYTDNNPQKWGTFIRGKKVISPSELLEFNNKILISCGFEYTDEIKNQLKLMGLQNRIIDKYFFAQKATNVHISDFKYLKEMKINHNAKKNVIVDSFFGNGWGGLETWSYAVAKGLADHGYNVEVIGLQSQMKQPYELEKLIKRYTIDKKSKWEIISKLVSDLAMKLPLVLINNWTEHVFTACCILKHYFPNDVKIISVIHGDWNVAYEKQTYWQNSFDGIICTTSKMSSIMQNKYKVKKEKLYYKELTVNFDAQFKKEYSKKEEAIRIGYAARLEPAVKRTDLLPSFIKKLEEKNIDYILEIAGDGPCFDLIKNYIHEYKLESKIKLLGYVKRDGMPEFWKRQDVFINFSKYEGSCLSMLEAMSYGVVPVVTDVSGARDFIKNGINGFISDVEDIDSIVKNIGYLYENRGKLSEYGNICREEIRTRCDKEDYVNFIEKVCGLK